MLFTWPSFVLLFLPAAVAVFYILQKKFKRTTALSWLLAVSLFFYATWHPPDLFILAVLIISNFAFGHLIARNTFRVSARLWLATGIAWNLFVLGYFKYAEFVSENLAHLFGA